MRTEAQTAPATAGGTDVTPECVSHLLSGLYTAEWLN